jgi:hypothetical protein
MRRKTGNGPLDVLHGPFTEHSERDEEPRPLG